MLTKLKVIKFVSRWSVGIIVDLVGLHYTHNALIALVLASVAFFLTKFVMGLWTTPLDDYYNAIRSGKPEQIMAAKAWMDALEKGDKVAANAAYDTLAKAIREGK
jgi:hypothetical protein